LFRHFTSFSLLVFFKQFASSGPGVVLGILVRSQSRYHTLGRYRKSGDHPLEDLAKSGCKSEISKNIESSFYMFGYTMKAKYMNPAIFELIFSLSR